MMQTFSHRFWNRLVIVDDLGISERRANCLVTFIPWEEIERVGTTGVRSDRGAKISLRLSPEKRQEFAAFASEIWSQRFPSRWQHNRERAIREANWAAYFWLPLLVLSPCIGLYIFFWFLGWPEYLKEHLQRLNRLTIMGVIFLVGFLIWYRWRIRKAQAQNRFYGS